MFLDKIRYPGCRWLIVWLCVGTGRGGAKAEAADTSAERVFFDMDGTCPIPKGVEL